MKIVPYSGQDLPARCYRSSYVESLIKDGWRRARTLREISEVSGIPLKFLQDWVLYWLESGA